MSGSRSSSRTPTDPSGKSTVTEFKPIRLGWAIALWCR